MTETNQEKTTPTPAEEAPVESTPQEQLLTPTLVNQFEQTLGKESHKAYEHWGFALFHSVSDEQAQRELQRLGIKPRDELDFYNGGCLLAGEEKYGDAARAFAKACELNPNFSEALYNLALAQEMSGNTDEAKKSWKELLNVVKDEEEATQIRTHLRELPGA